MSQRVSRIGTDGLERHVAGSGRAPCGEGRRCYPARRELAQRAQIVGLADLQAAPDGSWYYEESFNEPDSYGRPLRGYNFAEEIRRVTPDGVVSTVYRVVQKLNNRGIDAFAVAPGGAGVLVAQDFDDRNKAGDRILHVSPNGAVRVWAGSGPWGIRKLSEIRVQRASVRGNRVVVTGAVWPRSARMRWSLTSPGAKRRPGRSARLAQGVLRAKNGKFRWARTVRTPGKYFFHVTEIPTVSQPDHGSASFVIKRAGR